MSVEVFDVHKNVGQRCLIREPIVKRGLFIAESKRSNVNGHLRREIMAHNSTIVISAQREGSG